MKKSTIFICCFLILSLVSGQYLNAQTSINIAPSASAVTASYTAAWNNLYSINNKNIGYGSVGGGTPVLGNSETWGTWSDNRPASQWLRYEWSNPMDINKTVICFWCDNASANAGDGVALPSDWKIQYWDNSLSDWVDVSLLEGQSYALNIDKPNTVEFASVNTTKLQVVMNASTNGTSYAAVGVTEWEAYSIVEGPVISTNTNAIILSDVQKSIVTFNIKGLNLSEDITIEVSSGLTNLQLSTQIVAKNEAESATGADVTVELLNVPASNATGSLNLTCGSLIQSLDVVISCDSQCFTEAEGNMVPDPYGFSLDGLTTWGTAPQVTSILEGADIKCGATCLLFKGEQTGVEVNDRFFAQGDHKISGWIKTNGTFETGIYANGANLSSVDITALDELKGGDAINFLLPNTGGVWEYFEFNFTVGTSAFGGCWINNDRNKTATEIYLDNWQVYDAAIITSEINGKSDYVIQPVTFNKVNLSDQFWAPRIQQNQDVTIPIALDQCYSTGRVDNFLKAAGLKEGYFSTEYTFDDTDIYKILEGMSYSVQMFPNTELEAEMDYLIDIIGSAQETDGYLYTARTAGEPGNLHSWVGINRWVNVPDLSHELYNCGHLYEAAVAHYQATGKSNLLDIAVKSADLLVDVFLKGGLTYEPGHQIVEMGLVKMSRATGNEDYLKLAKYFLDLRGNKGVMRKEYSQSHKPVIYQEEAVGHAVRAVYMYSGMADVAALTGNSAYMQAIETIWHNVVDKKYYINGGIGASHGGEAFGVNYELPNHTAYCETCASIGNVYWNHRMFLQHGDSKYYDIIERTLYNGVISGISLSGDHFFYPNPLASDAQYLFNHGSNTRQEWFGCACCPSNLCRFIPSMPGYIYAQKNDSVYINLFVEGNTKLKIGTDSVQISQITNYPWDGDVQINIDPSKTENFNVLVRVPGWAKGKPVPGDLYSYLETSGEDVVVKLNDNEIKGYTNDKGYIVLSREWNAGDRVNIHFPMSVHKTVANSKVTEDVGKVALERGPILYCLEWPDNDAVFSSVIDDAATITTVNEPDLLNGVLSLNINGKIAQDSAKQIVLKDAALKAIPYYSWDNRGIGEMAVWIPRTKDYASPLPADIENCDTITYKLIQKPFAGGTSSVYPYTVVEADVAHISDFFGISREELTSLFGSSIQYAAINSNGTADSNSTAVHPGHWFDNSGNITTWSNNSYIFSELKLNDFQFFVGQYPDVCNNGDSYKIMQALTYTPSGGERKRVVFVFNISVSSDISIGGETSNALINTYSVNNHLYIENLPLNSTICIYDICGRLILNKSLQQENFDIELNPGIKIVKINNKEIRKVIIM
ncbi:beta-L-arabinofuranosidase domain-containing protein [Plebeiibacterium marinum]|uniref:Glycoside hydrolase family 127 protein n=1 Tax=Plebeiibacterium marinum TaxID=2992111 RepID=A0AAE3MHR4_9BACT|nr:beta-L-arabinofuranosidase domain-containing protein [Plebeiobacterium marinum]MCW3807956.1 glycoside hydrolase family 127 protein [Plebeiobacterium marinum]